MLLSFYRVVSPNLLDSELEKTHIYFLALSNLMHKQTTFIIITAAILLAATLATAIYSLKEANAQTNKTSAGGNKTEMVTSKNPLSNITIGGQKNITRTAGGNITNKTN